MNETLYSWTFKFHTVVRRQNSGVVEDFILRIPEFMYESKSEKIIEIGPHLQIYRKNKWLLFKVPRFQLSNY